MLPITPDAWEQTDLANIGLVMLAAINRDNSVACQARTSTVRSNGHGVQWPTSQAIPLAFSDSSHKPKIDARTWPIAITIQCLGKTAEQRTSLTSDSRAQRQIHSVLREFSRRNPSQACRQAAKLNRRARFGLSLRLVDELRLIERATDRRIQERRKRYRRTRSRLSQWRPLRAGGTGICRCGESPLPIGDELSERLAWDRQTSKSPYISL